MGIEVLNNELNEVFYFRFMSGFTTAGPVVLDSISCIKGTTSYLVKTYLNNRSAATTITRASVKIICDDPWALPIINNVRILPNILPGASVVNSMAFGIGYIDSLFPGYFNFKVEIMSDNFIYWTDLIQVVVGVEDNRLVPLVFNLEQNYPNPFNPATKISYGIPVSSEVIIKVFDILGNTIEQFIEGVKPSGSYELIWNAGNLSSGIYFYEFSALPQNRETGVYTETKKMILLK